MNEFKLTATDMITELAEFHSIDNIASKIGLSSLDLNHINLSPEHHNKLQRVFSEHVTNNLEQVNIKELIETKSDYSVIIDTPDGLQAINDFYIKSARQCFKVETKSHSIECSHDHLIETPSGWVMTKELSIGAEVMTKSGIEPVTTITELDDQVVYDFEVNSNEHRYWSGDGISSHNSGKSFIAANVMRNAQDEGVFNLVIDSENALDDDFVSGIGVDPTADNYMYKSVVTIFQVTKLVSAFISSYKKTYAADPSEAPKVHITLDSLDMLMTDTEVVNYEKGNTKGDLGQRAKQIKAMLRTFVQDIKGTNISMIVTTQVYANQDLMNGLGNWIVNEATKYSVSQIILLTKLKLKNADKEVTGIRMKAEGYKTRFTKPFQTVTILVPYDTGMDPNSGLLDVAVEQGLVSQAGAWYTLSIPGEEPIKFQSKNFHKYAEQVIAAVGDKAYLTADTSDSIEEGIKESAKKQRGMKFNANADTED